MLRPNPLAALACLKRALSTSSASESPVRIVRLELYHLDIHLPGGYRFSKASNFEHATSSIVRLTANNGVVGFGETCPIGSTYLPAFARGIRSAMEELGPKILGQDPTKLMQFNLHMDNSLKGHPYVKAPIDLACWDILGKLCNLPICDLLGGRYGDDFPLYRAIGQDTPDKMAADVRKYRNEGYRKFQLKNGNDPEVDIDRIRACAQELERGELLIADANTSWTTHEAVRVIHELQDLRGVALYIEQPCLTYEECLSVRRQCMRPFILDECVDSLQMVHRLYADKAADVINLKISKVGGLTKAKLIRDACAVLGISMNVEDTWTTDIGGAGVEHLAHSTPPEVLFASSDLKSYHEPADTAKYAPKRVNGRMAAPTRPGLGVEPMMELLGEPVLVIE